MILNLIERTEAIVFSLPYRKPDDKLKYMSCHIKLSGIKRGYKT